MTPHFFEDPTFQLELHPLFIDWIFSRVIVASPPFQTTSDLVTLYFDAHVDHFPYLLIPNH